MTAEVVMKPGGAWELRLEPETDMEKSIMQIMHVHGDGSLARGAHAFIVVDDKGETEAIRIKGDA